MLCFIMQYNVIFCLFVVRVIHRQTFVNGNIILYSCAPACESISAHISNVQSDVIQSTSIASCELSTFYSSATPIRCTLIASSRVLVKQEWPNGEIREGKKFANALLTEGRITYPNGMMRQGKQFEWCKSKDGKYWRLLSFVGKEIHAHPQSAPLQQQKYLADHYNIKLPEANSENQNVLYTSSGGYVVCENGETDISPFAYVAFKKLVFFFLFFF